MRFHQKSENGEVYVLKDGSDGEEDLVASKYPTGVPTNHPRIRDGMRALNLYKDYHRYQIAKQMQQKRNARSVKTVVPNNRVARLAPVTQHEGTIKTKMEQ